MLHGIYLEVYAVASGEPSKLKPKHGISRSKSHAAINMSTLLEVPTFQDNIWDATHIPRRASLGLGTL